VHEISQHSKEILNNTNNNEVIQNVMNSEQNVMNIEQNVMNIEQHVMNSEQNVMNSENDIINQLFNNNTLQNILNNDTKIKYFCSKCSKEYLTIKHLKNHEEKCLGIGILTCPKCMKTFSNRQNKSAHIKRNNCKAKSIINAINPNIQNIITNNNINNINNINSYNNNNNTINNTFIINNYGSERIDYLSDDDMFKILKSYNSISLYIEKKHFNKDFPENHNILYDEKLKRCKIKENNTWKTINLSLMSTKLINDNSSSLLSYFNKHDKELNEKIHNEEIYYYIINKLLLIYNKNDKEKYNTLFNLIKYIIENNTF